MLDRSARRMLRPGAVVVTPTGRRAIVLQVIRGADGAGAVTLELEYLDRDGGTVELAARLLQPARGRPPSVR